LERDDPAGANESGQARQCCNGIEKVLQNETANGRIKRPDTRHLTDIGFYEGHVPQAGCGNPFPGPREGPRLALYANYLAGGANQPGQQHCDIPNA
jgi:hypothetical protein